MPNPNDDKPTWGTVECPFQVFDDPAKNLDAGRLLGGMADAYIAREKERSVQKLREQMLTALILGGIPKVGS